MATEEDFAKTEWAVLCDAAHGTGIAMMMAGSSGLVGSMKELLAAGRTEAAGATHENELIRSICTSKASSEMRERFAGLNSPEALRSATVEWLSEAVSVLKRKSPDNLPAYRTWVLAFADTVAKAANEDAFLGIGAGSVSAEEATYLATVRAALG